jgi:hypothetical protein
LAGDKPKPEYEVKFELWALEGFAGTETVSLAEGARTLCRTDRWSDPVTEAYEPGYRMVRRYRGEDLEAWLRSCRWVRPGVWNIDVSAPANKDEGSPRVPRSRTALQNEVRLDIAVENCSTDTLATIGGFRYGKTSSHTETLRLAETKRIVLERNDAGEPMTWLDVTLVAISDARAQKKLDGASPVDTPPPTSRPLTHRPEAQEPVDERSIFQFIVGFTR